MPEFCYHPLRNTDERILSIAVVATEMSKSVQARQQVEQLNADLKARVAERTRELGEQQTRLSELLDQIPAYGARNTALAAIVADRVAGDF